MDFVQDWTADDRPLRMLVVLDEYPRECLSIEVRRRLRGKDGKFAELGRRIAGGRWPEFHAARAKSRPGEDQLEKRHLPSRTRAAFVCRDQRSKQSRKAVNSRLHRKSRFVERTTPPTHVDSLNGVHRHDCAHRLHKRLRVFWNRSHATA